MQLGGNGNPGRERSASLLSTLHCPSSAAGLEGQRRQAIRDELVQINLPLVEYLARRFSDRGEPLRDLMQVGTIGLIKSIDRFEPERGLEFTTYATPTILGEIKRYFRDSGWLIKVPRRAQELQSSVGNSRSSLSQRFGRAPTVREIAADIGTSPEDVVQALEAARAYSATPLDQLADVESASGTHEALTRNVDEFIQVEDRTMLAPALDTLSDTEREVLILRFYSGRTQTEIASVLGLSQMQVSRVMARSLHKLRGSLGSAGVGSGGER